MVCPSSPNAIARRGARLAIGLAFVLAGALGTAHAETGTPFGDLSLHGFGTLGVARSNTDSAEYPRDLSQPRGTSRDWTGRPDSLLGLQANLRASDQVEFVVQAVSRYNWEGNYRPEVNWAFVKFDPTANVTLRAGRLGTEFYMLADSRHVGYSYLTVRPPGDYYGTLPFNYLDGIDAALTLPTADGLWRAKAFYGHDPESLPIAGEEWRLRGSRMAGGYIDYRSGAWQWRAGAAEIRFERNFPLLEPLLDAVNGVAAATGITQAATAASQLAVAGKTARMYSAGAVYDDGPLQVQLMLSQIRQESATYENTRAGYLIGGYRFGEFTPFAGLSWTHGKKHKVDTGLAGIPPLSPLDSAVTDYLRKGHTDQETLIIGGRWDFRRNLALKAQVDLVRGNADSIFLIQRNTPEYTGRINVFSLALDFVF